MGFRKKCVFNWSISVEELVKNTLVNPTIVNKNANPNDRNKRAKNNMCSMETN